LRSSPGVEAQAGDEPITAAADAIVRLIGVEKRFGDHVAVAPATLTIHRGDFVAILGPSGCGKTSLLRMIGGFLPPSAGTIEIGGRDVTRLGPDRRPTNMVFQGYGLFPHMTVRQNVAYGLRVARVGAAEAAARVDEMLSLVHLEALADRPVPQLSGGQAQRVALARALVMRPEVLLLDEPLAALDLTLRRAMQEELRRLHRTLGGTFVFVTHDQEEAMGLATRIVVMQGGRIVQEGTPRAVYDEPINRFVATFVGEANLLAGVRHDGRARLDIGAEFLSGGRDGAIEVLVRPQFIRLHGSGWRPHDGSATIVVEGRLVDRVFLGPNVKSTVAVGDIEVSVVGAADDASLDWAPGARVVAAWGTTHQRIVNEST
jgi:ABC-type Fe3+/spermidine/putrescine transport system ATPase subunit